MKRFLVFVLVSVVLCVSVFADPFPDEEYPSGREPSGPLPVSVDEINNSEDWEITDISVQSVSPVTPSDTTGLKQVLLDVLGSYDPVIVEYQYKNPNNSYYSYLREVQPDYVWIASFLMLLMFVYCVFRMGGALVG